jgi:hypothetical protein
VNPPGEEVTVYDVIGEPPLLVVMSNEIVADALPGTTLMMLGAAGTVDGMTCAEATDGWPVPLTFNAFTVNVYACPFVSPVTVSGLETPVFVIPPGLEVTMYDVIGEPPLLAGGLNEIVAWALPRTTPVIVGAPGTPAGVTAFDDADATPAPAAFVAVTLNV